MTTNFIGTLLTNSPTYTVTSGFSTLLYDAYGAQTVSVSSGGSLSLVGAMGANNIRLHGNADAWQVMRSGSTTVFIHTNGDRVEIPAIVDQQTISFADQSAILRIETSGNVPLVKLGTQAISTTTSAITAWGDANPDDPAGSYELAPWTLIMKHGGVTFVSDGSSSGTHDTDIQQGGAAYVTTPDFSHALAYGTGQGIWSIASSSSATKLTSTYFSVSDYSIYSDFVGILGQKIVFIPINSGKGVLTDGYSIQETDLEFGIGYVYGQQKLIDVSNGNIWTLVNSAPYGAELVQIYVTPEGLQSKLVKDIHGGATGSFDQLLGATLPDGRFVFSANDGSGNEPWVSDGTMLGTFMLADLVLDDYFGSSPYGFVNFNDRVAFTAYMSNENYFGQRHVLVLTDGTPEGTTWVDPIDGNAGHLSILGVANDQIFLMISQDNNNILYKTDGVSVTYLETISGNASLVAWTEQIAYFSASDSATGQELWALPLNESGTLSLVKDILDGTGSALAGYNHQQFLIGDKLAFTAYTTATRQSFYISDGTENGTVRLSDAMPSEHVIIGNNLYFTDISGTYMADTVPTEIVAIRIGDASTVLQSDDDQVYFLSNQDLFVIEEGSSESIKLAEGVAKMKVFQEDALYFIQQGSSGALSLWYSDGTSNGTRYIEDLPTNDLFNYDLDNSVAIRTIGVSDLPS